MLVVNNYKNIATHSDRYKSTFNKNDLIYLIRKFLRDNNGQVPVRNRLQKLKRGVLYGIWINNRPSDIFEQLRRGF